jgi:hypothetical protein
MLIGVFVTLIATGHIEIAEYTTTFHVFAYSILGFVFVLGLGINFYSAMKRKALFSPTLDGFLGGIAFMEALIVFLLYGFKL